MCTLHQKMTQHCHADCSGMTQTSKCHDVTDTLMCQVMTDAALTLRMSAIIMECKMSGNARQRLVLSTSAHHYALCNDVFRYVIV